MGTRRALLVATTRYVDPDLPDLAAPTDEVQRLAQLLRDPEIGEFDSAQVLLDSSKPVVEREMERLFSDCGHDDLVLLYVSGHGIKSAENQLFFALGSTECAHPYSTAVPAVIVQHLLQECRARNKAVLLDCCYSGLFARMPVAKSERSVELDLDLGAGTYIMTATNALERAFEDEELFQNRPRSFSVFTDAVIRGLGGAAAAHTGADIVTAEDLYDYVFTDLTSRDDSRGRPLPTRFNSARGSFMIAKATSTRLRVDETVPPLRLAALLPEVASVRSADFVVPIGQSHQARPGDEHVLSLHVTGRDGHVGIVGRAQSGKSVLLLTMIEALNFGRRPQDLTFYCLDSGGQLGQLRDYGSVREVIDPSDRDAVVALLDRIVETVEQRRTLFSRAGLTIGQYREYRAQVDSPEAAHSEIFLVIDGWDQFAEVREFAGHVKKIADVGLGLGVHVLLTARRWDDLPDRLIHQLGGRVEMMLNDPAESRLDPGLAATLPDQAGWGLCNGVRFRAAMPSHTAGGDMGLSAEEISRIVAALSAGNENAEPAEPAQPSPPAQPPESLLELLGIPGDPATFDVGAAWRHRPRRQRYRVAFGVDDDGAPVELDIKEAAEQGEGPHGLCVGATGSGKSELLRTLVTGLLATHSSEALNVILVDFKGGATFLGFDRAPHVAAVITNLAENLPLVDRMRDAIAGECARRQEMLGRANAKNVWDYERRRENGEDLDPLPALFVVIDEFAELLVSKPDFIEVFLQLGRVGRSLQMHMLLATQRLEEGKLRGLDTYLSYRIGLRTFSAAESRSAIGIPDAYELPPMPGSGYLVTAGQAVTKFRSAYVSRPWGPDDASQMDVILARLAGQGPPAHEVWLPPLEEPPSLDQLLPPISPTEDRGMSAVGFNGNGRLQVPLGLVDKPFEQRRDLMGADFSGASGHGVVVGGPQSGKSMLLRTLIMSMALTHTPVEVQFYALDLGGGTLASMSGLPHVGGVAGRSDRELARRMVAELSQLVTERERRFRAMGVDSMADFRNRRRRGEAQEDPFGDVFLLIDGWANFRTEFEALEQSVMNLTALGLSYGVHVLITANRWAEIRPAIRDLLGTRFELRLGDPSESDIDRRVAVNVPAGRPGRGLSRDKLHFLIGLPRIDASSDAEEVATGVRDATERMAAAWRGRPARPVRLLPEMVSYDDVLPPAPPVPGSRRLVPIGLDEDELAPVYLDFEAEPHFVAFTDVESGKTNLLRAVCRGIVEQYTSDEAVIVLVDYRRTMLGYIESEHLLGYAVSSAQLGGFIGDIKGSMDRRLPGPDVTQEQLKNRSWWKGPELFVVVDDYDLVATPNGNPLAPLGEFLAQAKDVGLHMIVARRTGGASRSTFDPIIGKLKEISSPGLVGAGTKDEGALWGTVKPSPMPPGRGTLVSRKAGQQLVQVAWTDADRRPTPRSGTPDT